MSEYATLAAHSDPALARLAEFLNFYAPALLLKSYSYIDQ